MSYHEEIEVVPRHKPQEYVKAVILAGIGLFLFFCLLAILISALLEHSKDFHTFLYNAGINLLVFLVALAIAGFCLAMIYLWRKFTLGQYIPVDASGGYWRGPRGDFIPLAPMIALPAKAVSKVNKTEVIPEVPTFFDLIDSGDIAPGSLQMITGYDKVMLVRGVLQLVTTPWPGTHAIAGRGRSGKTRRVIGEVCQALIGGARVTICDPHATKPDSLARSLEPLAAYLTIARNEEEIVEASEAFKQRMEDRVDTQDSLGVPEVIVYDEWSRLMDSNNPKMPEEGRDVLIYVAKNCATQFAGYLGFCIIVGHIWTNEACGGTEIRRSLQAAFIHQLNSEYAAFFFKQAKWKNRADELKRRECIYRDLDGQSREVMTIGIPDDTAMQVAAYLASIGVPALHLPVSSKQLPMPVPPMPYEQIAQHSLTLKKTVTMPDIPAMGPLPLKSETYPTKPLLVGAKRTIFDACQKLREDNERISSRNVEKLTGIDNDVVLPVLRELAQDGLIQWQGRNKS